MTETQGRVDWERGTDEVKIGFRVLAISSNCNSFGLHKVVLVAKDGTAIAGLKTAQFLPKPGDTLMLGKPVLTSLSKLGYECPEDLPEAPDLVVERLWGKPEPPKTSGRTVEDTSLEALGLTEEEVAAYTACRDQRRNARLARGH